MYFHEVKSTAHPPIKGALGHSTDLTKKQPNRAAIKIYLDLCNPAVSCWKRCSGCSRKFKVWKGGWRASENGELLCLLSHVSKVAHLCRSTGQLELEGH